MVCTPSKLFLATHVPFSYQFTEIFFVCVYIYKIIMRPFDVFTLENNFFSFMMWFDCRG